MKYIDVDVLAEYGAGTIAMRDAPLAHVTHNASKTLKPKGGVALHLNTDHRKLTNERIGGNFGLQFAVLGS